MSNIPFLCVDGYGWLTEDKNVIRGYFIDSCANVTTCGYWFFLILHNGYICT